MSLDESLRKSIMAALLPEKQKEYACHVQYVARIGLELAKEYSADEQVVEVACLLHDIGRDKELPGEDHSVTSRRIAEEILRTSSLQDAQKSLIYDCILTHGDEEVPDTLEQKIVRTADAGSKVEYHEAFMLMCRKPVYEERLAWGMKYLSKGFDKICVDSYREKVRSKYGELAAVYRDTLDASHYVI